MKKLVLIVMLVIYAVFSTGVFISIHHCCLHCCEKVEKIECNCHSDGQSCASTGEDQHHHCYDDYLFFKILDSYDKKKIVFSFALTIQQVFLFQDYRVLYDEILFHIVYREIDEAPPYFSAQGRTLTELYQQRVLYA